MTTERLREALRQASAAISEAEGRLDEGGPAHVALANVQVRQLKQRLLNEARKQLAFAHMELLETGAPPRLPGLPAHALGKAPYDAERALAAVWSNLAELQLLRSATQASIAAYQNVLTFSPDDVTAHAQLADLLETRHDLKRARAHAESALGLDPHSVVAALTLARVRLQQELFAEAEHAALAATEAPHATADDRALAWSLVGEARDRQDETAEAFKAFTRANQFMLRRYGDIRDMVAHPAHPTNVRHLASLVERSAPQRGHATFATPAPAFLIGFPRSGTTLLEQVLASHSNVTCLGETDYLFEALSVVLRDGDLFDRISALSATEIETVRAAYRRMVLRDYSSVAHHVIVDKHPLHITLLPLINKIFPDAKIIFAVRDPRDTVLSCFQQCFAINIATAQFLELESAAAYFDSVMSLMLVCRSKLTLDLHQVRYCDVVADLETQAREISAFLGLGFEPQMLRFNEHARTRTINSASARQVIQPLYDRSVGRWRRYERELAPVLPLLCKWARRLGYED